MPTTRHALLATLLLAGTALAGPLATDTGPRIEAATADIEADVPVFDAHVTYLASPFMEGRLPGTNGMDIARDYVEFYLRQAGLEAPFQTDDHQPSFRQPFPLGGTLEVADQAIALQGADAEFVPGTDFTATGMGASADARGDIVLVGYAIDNGPDGYASFDDDTDLEGKIAVMLRFEPVDEEGNARWSDRGWSPRASFANKLRAVAARNPAAVIIVNTPGTFDARADALITPDTSAGRGLDVPVFNMTSEAGDRLVRAATNDELTLLDYRRQADEDGALMELDAALAVSATLDTTPLMAENVAGLLPGKGDLADELVVIGAHLDHLGMGNFGSRAPADQQGRVVHPGADDNATGSAAILMLAERLEQEYAELPDDADARSILFVCFDAEESGLNGSRYYVNNPILPWEDHALMINFDMIGRITEQRLSVSGVNTAVGMQDWLQPLFEASPLEVIDRGPSGGGSDHLPFMQKQLPVLFAICTPLHPDYHTPGDTVAKINREDAVHTINLFEDILYSAATRPEPFVWNSGDSGPAAPSQAGPRMGAIKVRFGISPGNYDDEKPGVLVAAVTEGGSADKAGIQAGDRLVSWNGDKIDSIMAWMGMLADHDPGDKVNVGIIRDDKEMTLAVTLQARPSSGG